MSTGESVPMSFISCSLPTVLIGVRIIQHPRLPSEGERTSFAGLLFPFRRMTGRLSGFRCPLTTCLEEDMSSTRPVFAMKAANTLKLASVGRYQCQPASERLSGDQQVVGSDRTAGSFKLASDCPGDAGVSGIERNGLEHHTVQQFEIACCVLALASPVIKLEEHRGRQADVSRRMPARSHRQRLRPVVEKGNASICVQKIPHHSNARPMSRSAGIFG